MTKKFFSQCKEKFKALPPKKRWISLIAGLLVVVLVVGVICVVDNYNHPLGRVWQNRADRRAACIAAAYHDGEGAAHLGYLRVAVFNNVSGELDEFFDVFNGLKLRAIKEVSLEDRYRMEGTDEWYGGGCYMLQWREGRECHSYYVALPAYDGGELGDKTLTALAYFIEPGGYIDERSPLYFEVTKPEVLKKLEDFRPLTDPVEDWRREEAALQEHQDKIRIEAYGK